MTILGKLFGIRGESNDDGATNTTRTCDCCGSEVDESEIEEGQCEECNNSNSSGSAYCCGAIYDDGESTCGSCGDPL